MNGKDAVEGADRHGVTRSVGLSKAAQRRPIIKDRFVLKEQQYQKHKVVSKKTVVMRMT